MKLNKVLSTAMVLTMLAPTATSFAATADQTITGTNQQYNSDLTIQGQIATKQDELPVGMIDITLPTQVGFVIDKDGKFTGASGMKIQNGANSTEVKVSIATFADPTPSSGIILKSSSELTEGNKDTFTRSNVNLKLSANGQPSIDLLNNTLDTELVTLAAGSTASLTLDGLAGTAKTDSDVENNGANDDFVLTFKIEKTQN